jgi:hypothetical protein
MFGRSFSTLFTSCWIGMSAGTVKSDVKAALHMMGPVP